MYKKIVVLGMIVTLLFAGCTELTANTSLDVYGMAKEFVLDGLKAPATAIFPSISEASIKKEGNNKWIVRSYVDAQNSYGALIRTYYRCELVENSGMWTLIDLDTWT